MHSALYDIASRDLQVLFSKALKFSDLKVIFNWPVSEKTVSEIGGRLIEDFILTALPANIAISIEGIKGTFVKCTVPESHRSMEDISFTWRCPDNQVELELLVDVKGHNETKRGSRPNLASIRKCKDFYLQPPNKELWIFFCRYTPIISYKNNNTTIHYKIEETSFDKSGFFLLRHLSGNNMDPANIGSGGQILLARENKIELVSRSREEMLHFLNALSEHLANLKARIK